MKSILKPGYKFEKLLVLDIENRNLILSAKYSLVNTTQQLPVDATHVYPNSVVPGYICNIIDTGCFVRFIGRLTGFAPKNRAADDQRVELSEVYYVGQSVRSKIEEVSSETGRITLSLKQSLCSSTDASFIQEYFILQDKIAELGLKSSWVKDFSIGNVIEASVHERKESGIVVSFHKYNDVFGFITHHQFGGSAVDIGSPIKAAVLDVAKMDRLVDLSMKPELVNRCTKMLKRSAHKDLEVNQIVNEVVEIVKENYLVVSIPDVKYAVGYASLTDYNTQGFNQNSLSMDKGVK